MQSKIYSSFTIQTFRIYKDFAEQALSSRIVSWLVLYVSPAFKPWRLIDKICSNINTVGVGRIALRLRLQNLGPRERRSRV
jgi:hypothetical protein